MLKLIDIVGFYIESNKCCIIEKIKNLSTNNNEFIICFMNNSKKDDIYYINQDISSFFNSLKGNGSGIYKENKEYVLKAKNLFNNDIIFNLEYYKKNPLNVPEISSLSFELSNFTFYEIMEFKLGDLNNLIIL